MPRVWRSCSECRISPQLDGLAAHQPSDDDANYSSGDDYIVEFLGYRFAFNACDFEQRVIAAAVRLGLVDPATTWTTTRRPTWSSSPPTAGSRSRAAGSATTSFATGSASALVEGESLVYWLRKLVFRGAWLDHRVKQGLLEVSGTTATADFGYRDPSGDRALLELAPVPSWHEVQFPA